MKNAFRFADLAGVVTMLVMSAALSFGQQIAGSISGVVQDNQQALIAGAKVLLANNAQASTREVTTGGEGIFVFTPLAAGRVQPDGGSGGIQGAPAMLRDPVRWIERLPWGCRNSVL